MDNTMINSFYKNLMSNKSDVRFLEEITGKDINSIEKLLDNEEDLNKIIESTAPAFNLSKKSRISKKMKARYLVMHYGSKSSISFESKAFLIKIIGFYFNKATIHSLIREEEILSKPRSISAARKHLSVFCCSSPDYLLLRDVDKAEAIRDIKAVFQSAKTTADFAYEMEEVLKLIRIINRSTYFNSFFKQK